MGGSSSSTHELEDDSEDRIDSSVFDPSLIQWDENGNLIYGAAHQVSPAQQLVEVMELDYEDDDKSQLKTWCIVDNVWLVAWLDFVHRNRWHAAAPGPCINNRLIRWDDSAQRYIGRPGLVMASAVSPGGDYRRISEETWEKFKEFYPSSGPKIELDLDPQHPMVEHSYPDHFRIVDPPQSPQKKVRKKGLFGRKLLRKKTARQDAHEQQQHPGTQDQSQPTIPPKPVPGLTQPDIERADIQPAITTTA